MSTKTPNKSVALPSSADKRFSSAARLRKMRPYFRPKGKSFKSGGGDLTSKGTADTEVTIDLYVRANEASVKKRLTLAVNNMSHHSGARHREMRHAR